MNAVVFSTYIPTKSEDFVIKSFEKDGVVETKTAPDGSNRVQYRTNLDALHLDENGTVDRKEREVTLSVLKPIDLKIGVFYELSGDVWVTHYQNNNGRIAVSIVAETVAPKTESKSPVASAEKSA